MSLLPALLLLFATATLSPSRAQTSGVCSNSHCTCSPAAHPSWTTVNCTVPRDQKLDIHEGDLPESTTDLTITGAEAVMFDVNSLSRLRDIRHLHLSDVNLILLRSSAATNLNIVNLYIEISQCSVLRFERKAFDSIKGPLSVTISDCDAVSLEGKTFSWLLSLRISNVHHLSVGPESFMLDPTADNVDEHGPGMLIHLKNLTVNEFPVQTFGSSAAGITMDEIEVTSIRAGAFSANTYNIVEAFNCSFYLVEGEAFAQTSLVNNLELFGCRINKFSSNALMSGVANLNISHCSIDNVHTGAINATVAVVAIQDNEFNKFKERGFELSYWNIFKLERNKFNDLPPHAIVAPGVSIHELVFAENEIETAQPNSLSFIGQAYAVAPSNVQYKYNYFGQTCHCNVSTWLSDVLNTEMTEEFEKNSYCTVDEFFARCFNVPDQNMVFHKFLEGVCGDQSTIQCEAFENTAESKIGNPRFPHKNKDDEEGGLTARNAKVIGIVIVTCFGCILLALLISVIRWMRRKGYCVNVKNFISTNSCGSFCDRICGCGCRRSDGIDNARSISQLSVNEYSERHRLNEPRAQEIVQETTLPDMYTEQATSMDDKTTQTLPEELTKELLENLKEKLEDPENYVEAREMIEHLYELIKVEESCNTNTAIPRHAEENIYELPFQNTAPRIGKNKKQMISVGTRTPSLDKLTPLSPYNRQTALAHEYFEPKDFAVHLYAEIANCEKEKKNLLGVMPDVVAEQVIPRGPYLRAVRDKLSSSSSSSPYPKSPLSSPTSPQSVSTIKSNSSTMSDSSNKMLNRPLPAKPAMCDPGEGTSCRHG